MENNVKFYDASNIDEFIWPDNPDAVYAKNYLYPMVKNGVEKYISNIDTKLAIINIDDIVLPVTINDKEYDNSYVCSIYSHYVSYAIEELKELKKTWLEKILKYIISFYGLILKTTLVNKVIIVNNWMLSTNLYVELSSKQIEKINCFLLNFFPNYAIVFRSVNDYAYNNFTNKFKENGYKLIASRQIYFLDQNKLKSKTKWLLRRDRKLISKGNYIIKRNDVKDESIVRNSELYKKLYIDKYSKLNPNFTSEFIKLAKSKRILNIIEVLDDNESVAVLGYFVRNGVMTTPLFGYDTALPVNFGLYRILSVILIDDSIKNNLLLNQSSGASEFKLCRGGVSCMEYSAVNYNHLSLLRKIPWLILKFICNFIGSFLLKKYKL